MKTVVAKKITKNDKLLVVPVFQNDENAKYPPQVGKIVKAQIAEKNFTGKEGETGLIYLPRKILLIGLGRKNKFNATKAREIFAQAAKLARKKSRSLTILVSKEIEKYGQEIGEGICLGNYTLAKFKTGKKARDVKKKTLAEIRTIGPLGNFKKGLKIAETVNYVRDLVVGPPNIVTAAYLADEAKEIAKEHGYKIKILDRKQIEKLKMGGITAVNSGSQKGDQQARFVIMRYDGGGKNDKPVVLVGKGLIFDSGGLNLKPGKGLNDMQQDMAGGAVILGVFSLLKKLGIKKNVVGLIPMTENLIDARSYKPTDIITSFSGKTIEITNTDAEGRLLLADALAYGVKNFKPACIIDIATLTGACMVALGDRYAGVFGNDQKLIDALKKAGGETDELVWQLPIHRDHKKKMESKIADLINVEETSLAGASTAAAFLREFVEKAKWAHLDIAGTTFTKDPKKYETRKATGYGVRLLVKFLENLAAGVQ